jgi:DNA-binding transcriptional LysR family regulator
MIFLLHAAPKTGNLAVRKSVDVTYAVYRASGHTFETDLPWVSIGTEVAISEPEKWVFRHHENQIHTWTNAPDILARLIAGGAGRGVLPTFVGDTMPGLVREGEPIEALTHPLWLAVNDDDRHRPEMRLALDRLAALFKSHEDRFAGRLPAVETAPPLRAAGRS